MDIMPAPKIHGMPDDNQGFLPEYFQGNTNECAIWSQWHVLRDYGINIDEKALVEQAKANGWYTDECGTPPDALGKLLDANGVPCDLMVDGNRYNLMNELAQGKRVIVTVDSSELWRENTVLAKLWEGVKDVFVSGEDHALVVSGIDTSDPDNIQVVLTDSGSGHRTISYPIDQFEDAWADGGCKMIVTRNPPAASLHLPSMINFDYGVGHIPAIGDVPFSEWQSEHADYLDDSTASAIGVGSESAAPEVEGDFECDAAVLGCADPAGAPDVLLVRRGSTATIRCGEDSDGDGNIDTIDVDVDGDGVPDITINLGNNVNETVDMARMIDGFGEPLSECS